MMRYLVLLCLLASCTGSKNGLKVAATPVPHAEMLEFIKPDLKAAGIDLEIIVTDDYNMPNRALSHKEIDANFFQHLPFLEAQIKEFGYQLEDLASIELEPMGIYSKKWKTLDKVPHRGSVSIPSDPTNEARALKLLADQGLITLDHPRNLQATPLNIVANPKDLKFIEVDAAMLPRTLFEVDLAVINTNYALEGGLDPLKQALALEGTNSPYTNILVIRKGDKTRPDLIALKEAMTSEKMKTFIEKTYKGTLIPAF